jgi:hypothetical protein
MKALTLGCCLLIIGMSNQLHSQSYLHEFQAAKFLLKDSTTREARVNVRMLVSRNTLQLEEAPSNAWSLWDVSSFTIDTTQYLVKELKNINDTVKVMERVIEGKISLYRSPRISPNEEIFAEKSGVVYQLRIVRKDINEGTYQVKEYSSILKILMLDCSQINQNKLEAVGFSVKDISKKVSEYNASCGWQKEFAARESLKPKFIFGVYAAYGRIDNKLYYNTGVIYKGHSSLTAVAGGVSLGLNFKKFNDTHVYLDIGIDKLTGEGAAYAQRHVYDMLRLRHAYTFNFGLYRNVNINISAGGGFIFQHLLSNKTIVERNIDPTRFHHDKDNFNLNPVGHLHLGYKSFAIRYQVIPLSLQMKEIELPGWEHRMSLHYYFRR